MVKFIFILVSLAYLSQNILLGQQDLININLKKLACIDSQKSYTDSVLVSVVDSGKFYKLSMHNTYKDTIYLFSSYLKEDLSRSKYLHRLSRHEKKYIISFLPILPFLGVKRPDVVILGEERIIKQSQVLYDFVNIPPNTILYLKIDHKVTEVQECVNNVDIEKVGRYDKLKFKTLKERPKGLLNYFEFAIYFKVDLLRDTNAYYLREFEFNKEAQKYKVLRIPYVEQIEL